MTHKSKLSTIGLLLLLALALIPSLIFPEQALIETTGAFKVATALQY